MDYGSDRDYTSKNASLNMKREIQEPLISIGMPVYNGARTLRRALDSVLTQDYSHFEVIISDNASTDDTAEICSEYVARDNRVRYYRSEKNMGLVWNFNRVLELASGKYFMWVAHDDDRLPSFISKCVESLEENNQAVLCAPYATGHVEEIDFPLHLNVMDSIVGISCVRTRFMEVMKNFPATAIYGLFRRSAMEKTRLFQNYNGADIVFVNELSLYGEFTQVPEVLFRYYGKMCRDCPSEALLTLNPDNRPPLLLFYFMIMYYNNIKAVLRSPLSFFYKIELIFRISLHELKVNIVKLIFRTSTNIFRQKRPQYINKLMENTIYSNPNFNILPVSDMNEKYELWKSWINNIYPQGIKLNKF
jgi:glycosyltransferase involved in cell wall biosynthesis